MRSRSLLACCSRCATSPAASRLGFQCRHQPERPNVHGRPAGRSQGLQASYRVALRQLDENRAGPEEAPRIFSSRPVATNRHQSGWLRRHANALSHSDRDRLLIHVCERDQSNRLQVGGELPARKRFSC